MARLDLYVVSAVTQPDVGDEGDHGIYLSIDYDGLHGPGAGGAPTAPSVTAAARQRSLWSYARCVTAGPPAPDR